MRIARLVVMGLFGVVTNLAGVSIFHWQFWALLVLIVAFGLLNNAEGYKDASGVYPWEKE